MRNHTKGWVTPMLILYWGLLFSTNTQAQVFVNLNASGANNGTSWANAYTNLQTALANTPSGEIWVARGTYQPVECNPCSQADKEISFQIPPDVQLYGGFAGTESILSQRDWLVNPTLLSGDIGTPRDSTDNSYKVVVAENSTPNTILDGFIIEEGNADGSFGFSSGGGLYMDANPGGTADMQVRNCTFRNNYGGGGGGLAIDCVLGGSSRAFVYNCIFEGNTASLRVVSTGAAVFIQGNAGTLIQPRFVKCTFRNNFCANDGGAFSATPTGEGSLLAFEIDSCLFENNRATDRGAAVWYRMSSQGRSAVSIKNSQFIQNTAGGQGGAIYARSSFGNIANDTIINCLFSQNMADGSSDFNDGEGGAVFIRGSQDGIRNHHIINCAFDRNFAEGKGGAIGTTSFFSSAGECNMVLLNCTFSRNATNGSGGALHVEGEQGINNNLLANNIFWQDSSEMTADEVFNNAGNVAAFSNNFDGGLPPNVTDGGKNTALDPQFASPENGDLHLLSSSPLVDAGDNVSIANITATDLDGNKRIHNGTVDLGAYEIGVIYVDLTATSGRQNGTSWENAFLTVPEALDVARSGDQIWVAEGTYYPTDCPACTESDKEVAMRLVPNVELYGGFQGNETQLEQRDWAAFPTILSGDIGVPGDSTDNSYNVLIAKNSTVLTILDGFIIEEGNADGSFGFSAGGGLFLDANTGGTADLQVRNCSFRNNYGGGGGALAIDCVLGGSSEALFYNCLFEKNTASLRVVSTGAAVFMQGNSGAILKPRFVKCTFQNNYCANDGGAFSATPTGEGSLLAFEIDSCSFINNQAGDRGGAVWYRMSSFGLSQVVIKNTEFLSNVAGGQGGAIFARSSFDNVSNDTIINCVFRENLSDGSSTVNDGEGGAIYLRGTQNGSRNHHIINSVFEGNFASERGGAIATNSFFTEPGSLQADIINCTFYQNSAGDDGNAFYCEASQGNHQLNIVNSILWKNEGSGLQVEIFNNGGSVSVAHSNVTDPLPDNISDLGNNLFEDPQFIDPDNGNLQISSCSPMIDAGDNTALPEDRIDIDQDSIFFESIPLDLLGENRIFNDIIDLGAYEWGGTPPVLSISINSSQVNCNNLCEAGATIEVQGGVSGYQFQWSDGQNTATAQGLCAGTYYLTVTDAANCMLTDSVIIREFPVLELQTTSDTSICSGEPLILTAEASGGAGNYTYSWNQNLGMGATHEVSPAESTTYTVEAVDSNNCRLEKSVRIDIDQKPLIELADTYSFCPGLSVNLDPGIFSSYKWSNGDTSQQLLIDQKGSYSVIVTDENGCSAQSSFEIIELESPEVSILGDSITCEGKTTTLDAGIHENYAWSSGETTAQIVVNSPGVYEVSVSDGNGCRGVGSIEIERLGPPNPSISGNTSFCLGGQAVLKASDGFVSYQWSDGSTNQELRTNQIGTVSLEVVDELGCVGNTSIEIDSDASPPSLSLDTNSLVITCAQECLELAVNVSGSIDYSVNWSSESGLFASPPDALTVEVCRADNYFVQVRDKITACQIRETVPVRENKNVPLIEPLENLPVFECNTEKISLSPSISEDVTQIQWSTENGGTISPSANELNIEVDGPGEYILEVTAANGCQASRSFSIASELVYPLAVAGNDRMIGCGERILLDGSISDQGTDFSAVWQSEENNEIINPSSLTPEITAPGSYILTIQNLKNGCVATDSVTVSIQYPEAANAGADVFICDEVSTLSANLPEGTEGFWTTNSSVVIVDPAAAQTELAGLIPGEQSFTWTLSAPGCPDYSSDEVSITLFETPVANDDLLSINSGDNRAQTIDLTLNDQIPQSGLWEIDLLNEPEVGSIDALTDGKLFYSVPKGAFGETSLTYRLCSLECPDRCSEARILIRVEQEKITTEEVPNAITPNEDGVNDRFVFDILEVNPPDRFPDNELIVFNRWGDLVFQQKNYDNSWNGVNQRGEPLPTGTYYFILRLDLEDGYIIRGDISVIR